MCTDFDVTAQMTILVDSFLKCVEGRTRDVMPNLLMLVGYVVSLPHDVTEKIFQSKGKSPGVKAKE